MRRSVLTSTTLPVRLATPMLIVVAIPDGVLRTKNVFAVFVLLVGPSTRRLLKFESLIVAPPTMLPLIDDAPSFTDRAVWSSESSTTSAVEFPSIVIVPDKPLAPRGDTLLPPKVTLSVPACPLMINVLPAPVAVTAVTSVPGPVSSVVVIADGVPVMSYLLFAVPPLTSSALKSAYSIVAGSRPVSDAALEHHVVPGRVIGGVVDRQARVCPPPR